MGVEDPVEMALVGVCEMIGPPQQGEAGSEQVRFVCWGTLIGVAALELSSPMDGAFPPASGPGLCWRVRR